MTVSLFQHHTMQMQCCISPSCLHTHLHVVYPLWEQADESFSSPDKDLKVFQIKRFKHESHCHHLCKWVAQLPHSSSWVLWQSTKTRYREAHKTGRHCFFSVSASEIPFITMPTPLGLICLSKQAISLLLSGGQITFTAYSLSIL